MLKQLERKNGHLRIECNGKEITVGDFLHISDGAGKPPFYGVVTDIVVFRKGRKVRSCNILLQDQTKNRGRLISLGPNCVSADRITVMTALRIANDMNDIQERHFALRAAVAKVRDDLGLLAR